jgi:PAS domain S-box-containing protein
MRPGVATAESDRAAVWIVEDSPLEAEVAGAALASSNAIKIFPSGDMMLEHLASHGSPDVLVLDWRLPGLSGVEICRFLRANPTTLTLPVLLMTYGTTDDLVEAFAAGADDYLAKPFDPSELAARVAVLLRGRRLRRRSERAERALRTLLAHLPHGIVALDARGVVTYVNATATQIFARAEDELVGRGVAELLPGVAAALAARDARGDDAATDDDALSDVTIGARVFVPVPRPLPTDDRPGTVLVLRDVTSERAATAALRESEERFRLVAEAAADGIWDWNVATGETYSSDRLLGMLGLARAGAWHDFEAFVAGVHPDDRGAVRAAFAAHFRERGRVEIELRMRHATGEYVPCVLRGEAHYNDAGAVARVVGAITDVTGRKRAEAERGELLRRAQAARDEAEEASRAKDQFLAMISHELRTPLTAILGWARMLRGDVLTDEKRARALLTIERNAQTQTQLIEDLLDISRIVTGKLVLDVQPTDLGEVVRATIDGVRPAVEAKALRLEAHIADDAEKVLGDPTRLQQVVWNLLTNAVKFTPRGGRVMIDVRRVGAAVEIAVSDTGQGISPEFLPHVFERFRQADVGVSRAHGGLGLGLAIVRHLIELHDGTITAESPGEGRGATFRVRLPAHPGRAADVAAIRARGQMREWEPPPDLTGLRVVLVEDEPDARELLTSVLEQAHAEVTVTTNAEDGYGALCRVRPDVLVTDIGMPGEDGYSLIRRVRALPPDQGGRTPSVALTAFARMEDRTRAIRAGFDLHVPKPIEPAELVVTVAGLAGRFRRP